MTHNLRVLDRNLLQKGMVLAVLASLLAGMAPSMPAKAANSVPLILNYQARITDGSGVPVPDGNLNLWIRVYDAASSGSCLYSMRGSCGSPSFKNVNVTNGVFSMLIGDQAGGDNPMPEELFNTNALFLGVTVASDTEMVPRKRITTAPYAVNADRLDDLDVTSSGSTTPYIPSTTTNGNLVITGDPQGSSVQHGSLYVNPASASASETLFGIADGGTSRWTVDKEGDITHSGSLLATAASSTAQFIFRGAASQSQNIFEVQDSFTNRMLAVSATATTIGSTSSTDAVVFNSRVGSNFTPTTDAAFDLGDYNRRWRDLWLSGGSAHIAYDQSGSSVMKLGISSTTGYRGVISTASDMPLQLRTTHSATDTNGIYIDTAGRVGIGTLANYTAPLHVNREQVGGVGGMIMITNRATATVGNAARLGFDVIGFEDEMSTATIDARLANAGTGATNLVFNAYDGSGNLDAYEKMRIVGSSGFVGFGTSTPTDTVHIKRPGGAGGLTIQGNQSDISLVSNTGTAGFIVGRSILVDNNNDFFVFDDVNDLVRFAITSTGLVGIGDPFPDSLLDVLSSGAANTVVKIANTNAGTFDPSIGFELVEGTHAFTMGVDDSDADKFKISTTALGTNDRFVIDSSGNVGIGASTPANQLHVQGAESTEWIRIESTAAGTAGGFDMYSSGTGGFQPGTVGFNSVGSFSMLFNIAGSERARIDANGSVGIGNAAPANRLTVGSATSTFEVDAAGNLIKVNNVPYSWPSAQGGASTVLTNNGSGVLTWSAASGGGTLQSAYEASSATNSTEIFLDSTHRALTIADSFSSYAGNLFEIQDRTNAAGDFSKRYLSVSATSTLIGVTSSGTGIPLPGYKVGIGTGSPAAPLTLNADSNTAGFRMTGADGPNEILDVYVAATGFAVFDLTAGSDTQQFFDFRPEDDSSGIVLRDSSGASTDYANFYMANAAVDYLNIVINAPTTTTTGLVIDDDNQVGIGTITPDAMLDISTGAGSNPDLHFSDADVAHGMTLLVPTDVLGRIGPFSSTAGGGVFSGFSDADSLGAALWGHIGAADPTDTVPAVELRGYKKNGTDRQALGAAETVLGVNNAGGSNLLVVMGNGRVGVGTTAPSQLLDVDTSNSGNTNFIRVSNGSNTANSGARLTQVVAGTSAGDPATTWNIFGVQAWSAGIDNSDSDKFKISSDVAGDLGTDTRLTIDTSGNVGIGNSAPGSLLTVGDASSTDAVDFSGSRIASNLTPTTDNAYDLGDYDRRWRDLWLSGGSANIAYDTSGTSIMKLGFETAQGLRGVIRTPTGTPLQLRSGLGTTSGGITINGSNNVGFGTVNPQSQIHATGDIRTDSILALRRDDPNSIIDIFPQGGSGGRNWWVGATRSGSGIVSAGSFYIWDQTAAALRFTIGSGGNVGIGDDSPTSLLTVGAGDAFQVGSSGNLVWSSANSFSLANTTNALNIDSGTLSIDALNNRVGIGTTAIPVSGVGSAKLAISGTAASAAEGPHVQFSAPGDYPMLQMLNWTHDNIAFNFDAYYDTAFRSADPGSNFQIYKINDSLNFNYASGVTENSAVTFVNGFNLKPTGNVGIGNTAPANRLTVGSATSTLEVDAAGNLVKVNNVPYSWPASQGGASTVLQNNGSGVLTWATASGVANLQAAYNAASSTTELSISGGNALTLADTLSGVGNIFEIQDLTNPVTGSYSRRYFTVSATSTLLNPSALATYEVGIGTSAPDAILHVQGAISTSNNLFQMTDSTASGGYLKVTDGTSIGGQFIPAIISKAAGTGFADRAGLLLWGEPGEDGADDPAIDLLGLLNGSPLVNAPVLRIRNGGTVIAEFEANGDFDVDTNTLFVDASANSVGIGDTTPDTILDVESTVAQLFALNRTSTSVGEWRFTVTSDPVGGGDIYSNGSLTILGQTASTDFGIRAGNSGTPQFTLLDTGNVGIGNTAPANRLTVGNATSTFEVNAGGNLVRINAVPYSWPSSQGGASTVLTNNGSGVLTWAAAGGTTTLQQAYDNDANGGDVTITTNSTDGDVIIAGDQEFRVNTPFFNVSQTTDPTASNVTLHDFVLDTQWTEGTMIRADFGTTTTQTGPIFGSAFNFLNNLTTAGQSVTGYEVRMPVVTTSTFGNDYYGFNIPESGKLTQNATGTILAWAGLNMAFPDTQENTGSGILSATGVNIVGGAASAGNTGRMTGVNVDLGTGASGGSITGIRLNMRGGTAATEQALYISDNWDNAITFAGTGQNSIGIGDGGNLVFRDGLGGSNFLMQLTDAGTKGNLSVTGNLAIGTASSTDSVDFSNARIASNLTPTTDNVYDLGDYNRRWKNLWLTGGSAHIAYDTSGTSVMSIGFDSSQGLRGLIRTPDNIPLQLRSGSSGTGGVVIAAGGAVTIPSLTVTSCTGCGGGSLQSAYTGSTSPELVLDATRGALTIRDASSPIGANLFEIQNNGGGSTYFAVTSSAISLGADLMPSAAPTEGDVTRSTFTIEAGAGPTGETNDVVVASDTFPVIAFYDQSDDNLRVAKCADTSCTSGTTFTTVDSTGDVGQEPSIALSSDGFPVISYYDNTNKDLKVVKCGNASCSSGNTITTVDSTGIVGSTSSIAVPSDGFPVISYYDFTNGDLKTVKCGNASCSSGNTVTTVESTNDVGAFSAIGFDGSDIPVIAFYDTTNSALRVLKCGNTSCSSGNSASSVDNTGSMGERPALAMSGDGFPIISYKDAGSVWLRVAKCGNAACTSGNTLTTLVSDGEAMGPSSIAIPSGANPVIVLHKDDGLGFRYLVLIKCANTSCSSATATTTIGTGGGLSNAVAISNDTFPFVSYFDSDATTLKSVKCGNANCNSGNTDNTLIGLSDPYGNFLDAATPSDGLPVASYYDSVGADLRFVKCGNAGCTSGNTITSLDTTGNVGTYTSVAVAASDLPVIAYYDVTNADLKVLKCGNTACTSGNTTTTVDSTGDVGKHASIAVGADNNPVISYFDDTNDDLKVVKCGNATCSSGNTTTTVDSTGIVGEYSSIAVDGSNIPHISYLDNTGVNLKFVKCGNSSCSANNSINTLDSTGNVGFYTSIVLPSDGFPAISYNDGTNANLKIVKCGNSDCTSGNAVTTLDSTNAVGNYTSIAALPSGTPVISYRYDTNADIRVLKCGNDACTTGNTITDVDTAGSSSYSSVTVRSGGYPVVFFHDSTTFGVPGLKAISCIDGACERAAAPSFTGGRNIGSTSSFFTNVYAATFWGKSYRIENFDLAETYRVVDSTVAAGDIVRIADGQTGGAPIVEKTTGTGDRAIGIISTQPGLLLAQWEDSDSQRPVALDGRVPTKVNLENGPIRPGDAIAPSSTPGVGMKSTKPGMIVGFALGAWSGPDQGVIEVFVNPGFHSGLAITTDGVKSLFNDDFSFLPPAYADSEITAVASRELSFIGSAWDAASSTSVTRSITQGLTVTDTSSYQLAFKNDDGQTLATLNNMGDLALAGTLSVSGGFDYAEMFPAAPDIDSGDIVMVDPSNTNGYGVKKTEAPYENSAIGVISTKPGFLTGDKRAAGEAPVALAGRVPVKVTMENGAIDAGDPITSSSTPGQGMKATEAGRVIGIALQPMAEDGTVLIFVNPSWWNGPTPVEGSLASGTLNITQDSLLDFKNSVISNVAAIISTNGTWGITSDGILAAKKVETEEVKTEVVTVKQTDARATLNEGVIKDGYDAVVIQNPAMTPRSEVFISFRGDPKGGTWVAEKGEGNFTVHLSQPAMGDLPFAYWIVGADDVRTPSSETESPVAPTETEPPAPEPEPEPEPETPAPDSSTTTPETAGESAPLMSE